MEAYLVDEEGRILKEIKDPNKYIELSDGDKVVRKGVLQYLSETIDIRYHFIKINPIIYGKMANKYPILNDLIEYLGYMDNVLSFKNGKPLEMKNLPSICNKSLSTIKRQIKGLIEEDVIHKIKDDRKRNVFIINPFVAMRGRKIYLSLYEEFKLSSLRSEVEEWDK